MKRGEGDEEARHTLASQFLYLHLRRQATLSLCASILYIPVDVTFSHWNTPLTVLVSLVVDWNGIADLTSRQEKCRHASVEQTKLVIGRVESCHP